MGGNQVLIWPAVRRAFGMLWSQRRELAAISIVPVMVVIATGMALPFLGRFLASGLPGGTGPAGMIAVRLAEAALLSLAAALLITPAIRLLCGKEAEPPLLGWSQAHSAVFWRILALHLFYRAAMLARAAVFARIYGGEGHSTASMVAFASIAGALIVFAVFMLTPWLLGASLGKPGLRRETGQAGPGRAARTALVVFAVVVPLLYALNLAFSALVFGALMISGALMAFLLPLGLVLPFLGVALGVSAALAAVAEPSLREGADQIS